METSSAFNKPVKLPIHIVYVRDDFRDAGGTGSVRSNFITCHVSVADDTEVVPPLLVAAVSNSSRPRAFRGASAVGTMRTGAGENLP